MQFNNEAQRLAIRAAFLRITADQSWETMRALADEVIYTLEQKSLQDDDEEKAKTYRHDARGARKFWEKWLALIELTKNGQPKDEDFLDVIM